MENQNKLSPEETDELRKSLEALDMSPEEIEDFIQKANKSDEKEESQETEKPKEEGEGSESTIAEKAEEAKEDDNKEPEVKDEKPAIEKAVEEEDLEKACSALKMQQAEIQKSIDEMEAKMVRRKSQLLKNQLRMTLKNHLANVLKISKNHFSLRWKSVSLSKVISSKVSKMN